MTHRKPMTVGATEAAAAAGGSLSVDPCTIHFDSNRSNDSCSYNNDHRRYPPATCLIIPVSSQRRITS